jgi:hypothetical protein
MVATSAYRDDLSNRLPRRTTIRNWSYARGLLDGSFAVADVQEFGIWVTGRNIRGDRMISRQDFETVSELWPA